MANKEHLNILLKGVDHWNQWRKKHPNIEPDLSGIPIPPVLNKGNITSPIRTIAAKKRIRYDLITSKSSKKIINFTKVNFFRSTFEGRYFPNTNFEGANFYEADLSRTVLYNANLRNCNFRKTYLAYADLRNSKIINANLNRANLVKTNLCGATIENCIVYGTSAWGLLVDSKTYQRGLMIEDTNAVGDDIVEQVAQISGGHYPMTVDDIEVAQFIHFIMNYQNLGKGLNAMLEKGVLLLGKFRDGGREILEFVAGEVRKKHLIPIIFDFDSPKGNNLIETVTVLAGISKFVMANLNGSSVPAELTRITANFKRPVITYSSSKDEKNIFAMFPDLLAEDNVLYFKYNSTQELIKKIASNISEAEKKFNQIDKQRAKKVQLKRENA